MDEDAREYEIIMTISVKKTGQINNAKQLEEWLENALARHDALIYVQWLEAEYTRDVEFG